MVKKIVLMMIFMGTLITSSFALAGGYHRTLLVLDMRNTPEFPKHFRTTSDPISISDNIDLTGLADLHAAGSSQFSKLALEKVLNKLKVLKVKNLIVVDLREESHGFLNGNAVSWYGPHNATNEGKRPNKIENMQARLLSELEKLNYVTVFKILQKSKDAIIEKVKPIDYLVHRVASEGDVLADNHLDYKRFYVQDFHPPAPKQVQEFIQFAKSLPPDTWILFHCRAGMGRTTVFMSMYDMMHNAKHVSFDDIIARQAALGGKDLKKLPPVGSYKYKFAVQRLKFLHKFYDYARNNDDNFQTPWQK